MKKLLILICIMLIALPISAQQITNVKQKIENGRIVITYDLQGSVEYVYIVFLEAKNNTGKQITPQAIAGDAGLVRPGKTKIIYWEPQLEGRNVKDWKVILSSKIENNLIFVQGGIFQMGSNNGSNDEKPVHSVTVSDFYIGKYEVTQKKWKEVMGNNPSSFKGDNLPVEKVSWYDAVEFCNKKSRAEGLTPCYTGSGKNIKCNFSANGYRLPTEAEWDYAAQGGNNSKGYTYAGGNTIGTVAWYTDNSGNKTHPLGTKQSNELGIYDMSGNVWEWCNDWYDEDYYSRSPKDNPKGPSSSSCRVLRGGSCSDNDYYCRIAFRDSNKPDGCFYDNGFRVVRTP